ncbi:hypothetical protein MAPG_10697 [Magnaporthiopsis poae ATCC 64411]|uniref:Uncharacterized protein n=1 Tax=Magnaporthiopsis poae (strain ATCC 64411 / 73-15) TaxID=644358 RepID=A0A0C4EDA3_MAGP6|nr:hypothetical protein MAPG_10697 [Magnaporthiopsis poae ATCC 64411]
MKLLKCVNPAMVSQMSVKKEIIDPIDRNYNSTERTMVRMAGGTMDHETIVNYKYLMNWVTSYQRHQDLSTEYTTIVNMSPSNKRVQSTDRDADCDSETESMAPALSVVNSDDSDEEVFQSIPPLGDQEQDVQQ